MCFPACVITVISLTFPSLHLVCFSVFPFACLSSVVPSLKGSVVSPPAFIFGSLNLASHVHTRLERFLCTCALLSGLTPCVLNPLFS